MSYNKFILFGDSITQFNGFYPYLQSRYVRKLDVLNRGYSGYNSEHARSILPRILQAESNEERSNIKLMTIFFGTNDAFEENNAIQPVPLTRYKENMTYLIDLALEYNIKLIVIGPGLHDYNLAKEKLDAPIATNNKRNLKYSQAIKDIAKTKNVAFIDTWHIMQENSDYSKEEILEDPPLKDFLSDGIHYTPRSYDILAREIHHSIKQNYPEFLPENLPFELSYWRDIDPNNLETIFTNKYFDRA